MLSSETYNRLINKARIFYFERNDSVVRRQQQLVKNQTDFKNYLNRNIGNSTLRLPYLEVKKKSKLLPLSLTGIGAAAAAFIIAFNYLYYLVLPNQQTITASAKVSITRPGFFWGQQSLRSKSFYTNHDSIYTLEKTTLELPGNTRAHLSTGSSLVASTGDDLIANQLVKGNYRFTFSKSDSKRSLFLPQDKEIRIAGTEIFIKTNERKSLIYLKKGKASIYQGGKKLAKLKKKKLYTLTDTDIKNKKVKKDKLAKIFASSRPANFEKEKHSLQLKKKTQKKKTKKPTKVKKNKVSLETLKKKGALVTVITRSGKKYIGVYKGKGTKTEILTTRGKVTINSSEIKVVKPYR